MPANQLEKYVSFPSRSRSHQRQGRDSNERHVIHIIEHAEKIGLRTTAYRIIEVER